MKTNASKLNVKVNKSLDKFEKVNLFEEKLKMAKKTIQEFGVPKKVKTA